jgi:hypothetical protein
MPGVVGRADGLLAFCAGDGGTIRALDALAIPVLAGVYVQEAPVSVRFCAAIFAAICSVLGRVVLDQPMSILLQEIIAPRGCDGRASVEGGLDFLIPEARARCIAAWYGVVALFVDCKFECAAEAILAVVMVVTLQVPQRFQLRVPVQADHAFRHAMAVREGVIGMWLGNLAGDYR